MDLVRPPSLRDVAREKFNALDTDKAGFIQSDKLQQLMESLELFADTEYVEVSSDWSIEYCSLIGQYVKGDETKAGS